MEGWDGWEGLFASNWLDSVYWDMSHCPFTSSGKGPVTKSAEFSEKCQKGVEHLQSKNLCCRFWENIMPLRWRMWSVSTTLRRERFSTSSPRWSSLRTGAPHGDRWSRTRTSWEPSRTSARRCRSASGWSSLLSIMSERRPLGEFVGKKQQQFFPKAFPSM